MAERTKEDVERLLDRMEALINEYDKSVDEFDRNQFKERNGEKLGKFEAIMKKLNGDDFDIYKESYDEYNRSFKDMDEEDYINKLVGVLDSKLSDLKDSLAEGNVAEAAHIAEQAEEQIEEIADKVDEEAHEEVDADAEKADAEVEKEEVKEDEPEAETETEETETVKENGEDEEDLEEELKDDKFRKMFLG